MGYKKQVEAYGVSVWCEKSKYYILNECSRDLCIKISEMLYDVPQSEFLLTIEPGQKQFVDFTGKRYRLSFEDKVLYFDNEADWKAPEPDGAVNVFWGVLELLSGDLPPRM